MNALPFSAILLAAGNSSRMHGQFKQLLLLPTAHGDEPAVRIAAQTLLGSEPEEVVVVTGHRGGEVMAALNGLPLAFQPNPRWPEGQITSVVAGLAALRKPCSAVMICLADLVLAQPEDYRALARTFAKLPRDAILVPHHDGARGNPVVFAASRVPEVISGTVNPGCRKLIENHPDDVVKFEVGHDRFTNDMDTPDDYARVHKHLASAYGCTA
ncbi:nucleotidyltransferase family protein [Rudaea sp.]|uniref:nucleotidyltransferase family protein n=1 Tax=Rudaea sp. TaxID=2136325 RepID=UPI002ED5F7C2